MRWFVPLVLAMSACLPKSVNERLGALEARVAQLERQPMPADMSAAQASEGAAAALYREAGDAVNRADWAAARAALAKIEADYGATDTARRARSMQQEVAAVGRQVTDTSGIAEWYQGSVDLTQGRHLVVFFEAWCPHCRREIPMVADRVAGREGDGVLITRLTRDSTEEQVRALLAEHSITLPTARETGVLADLLGVSGVPAAAVLLDGEVIWRGHPARLEGDLLDRVLPVQR